MIARALNRLLNAWWRYRRPPPNALALHTLEQRVEKLEQTWQRENELRAQARKGFGKAGFNNVHHLYRD